MRLPASALTVGLALITSACASGAAPDTATTAPATTAAATTAAATTDAVSTTMAPSVSLTTMIEPGGAVLSDESMAAPGDHTAHRIAYRSTNIDGTPNEVTGWIAVSGAAGPHRVLVFGHGTTGLGDSCTASTTATPFQWQAYLDAGWTVAYTDYQGLGTPGLHHYLVAEAAARSILDAARAARALDLSAATDVALYGFSQGGHAVLSAAERAPDLAPELTVISTIAVAPAVDLEAWFRSSPPGQQAYLAMIAVAYSDAYGLAVGTVLSNADLADRIATGCFFDTAAIIAENGNPFTEEAPEIIGPLLAVNEPATGMFDAPVLLVTGGEDDLFTAGVDRLLTDRLCSAGTPLSRLHIPTATHTQLSSLARGPALAWLSDPSTVEDPCHGS